MKRNNKTSKPSFGTRLKSAFRRLHSGRAYPPGMPYNPQPGQGSANPSSGNPVYSETEAEIASLWGTQLKFGSQTTIEIDQSGHAKALTCKPSYVIGSGRRISDIDEVGGVCGFCQEIAAKAFSEGKLTAEQAQLQSLFDGNSQRQCDVCGTFTCSVHSRPVQTPSGTVNICVACRNEISRQEKRKKIIGFLLSPFTDNSSEQN